MSTFENIRTWLYTILNGAITYNGTAVAVYSIAPTNAAYPHVVIGDMELVPANLNKECDIYDVSCEIIAVTKYTGVMATYKAADSIADDVLSKILNTTVKISNYELLMTLLSRRNTTVEQIDTGYIITHKIVINFKIEEE